MTDTFTYNGRLAMIGGGKMGEAIIGGLVSSGAIAAEHITVADPSEARRTILAETYGVTAVESGSEAAFGADVVVLAVKPQVIDSVVASLASSLRGSLVVSIAAGISCARLESELAAGTPVVRVMPNTPALVGAGMALVSGGSEATGEHVELVRSIFAAVGEAVVIDEKLQDAGTAVSGSGPAYFALVVDALARAGVAQGLPRDVAQALAVQTMFGTARMLSETGMHPEALVDGVSSPGGTTIAAINVLESAAVRAAFADAVAANVKRAKELGS